MGRPVAPKEEYVTNISREEGMPRHWGHGRRDQGWSGGGSGEKGGHGPEPLLGFSWEGMDEAGQGPEARAWMV